MGEQEDPREYYHQHHRSRVLARPKAADGGFWSAFIGFGLFLILVCTASSQIAVFYSPDATTRATVLAISTLLGFYSIYRKFKYHDYTMRQYWTNVFIWLILAFSLPSLIYYLFFYQQ